MAMRDIVLWTDSFLRKKSKTVEKFDEKLHELLDDMKETLEVEKGAGISAVQVGSLKRCFAISVNGVYMEFVNPVIEKTSGKQINMEGCLSVKLPPEYVKRPKKVTLSAFDRFGNQFSFTCTEWTAIAVMHEYDHLDGILYIDKIEKDIE